MFNKYLPTDENSLLQNIENITNVKNIDNVSRTSAYQGYYQKHKDIQWSFLASMVSRNAGWNMCDLEGDLFPEILEPSVRQRLFLTYERANWLIFKDAYPQLLLYHYSTKLKKPMFHLLEFFHVSSFMQREWMLYWHSRDSRRLMNALIVNEQNVIQVPVIKNHLYQRKVFHTAMFSFQDWFHFSSALFPTCNGELFGASVNGFKSIDKRIDLGKRLANILFNPRLYPDFFEFAIRTAHTGSRHDYEQYFPYRKRRETPFLRMTYPVVKHHIHKWTDWSLRKKIKSKWFEGEINHKHPLQITDWYERKQAQLKGFIYLKKGFFR
jgi:hypothetical protein